MSKQVVRIITTVLLPLSPRENPYQCARRGPIITPWTMVKEKTNNSSQTETVG